MKRGLFSQGQNLKIWSILSLSMCGKEGEKLILQRTPNVWLNSHSIKSSWV